MITTGYDLPFRVRISGLDQGVVQRGRLRVRIEPPADPPGAAARVVECVRLFGRLADAGALGGSGVAPWELEFGARPEPASEAGVIEYEISFKLPPQAWVVLAHLLARQADRAGLRELSVSGGAAQAGVIGLLKSPRGLSSYPRAQRPAPFAIDDQNPEGGTYSVYARLQSPMTASHEAVLNTWLADWVEAVRSGAYALAPIDPAGDYAEPHADGVDTYECVVEWTLYKLRADPVAAVNALINIFARFHWRCQPVLMLEIG